MAAVRSGWYTPSPQPLMMQPDRLAMHPALALLLISFLTLLAPASALRALAAAAPPCEAYLGIGHLHRGEGKLNLKMKKGKDHRGIMGAGGFSGWRRQARRGGGRRTTGGRRESGGAVGVALSRVRCVLRHTYRREKVPRT